MIDARDHNASASTTPDTLSAAERITRVRPYWRDTLRADQALGLRPDVLLHAGPPLRSRSDICRPLLNAACAALLFEGRAADAGQAEDLIARGEVELRPAQDFNVATPLAAVVTSSMWLHEVVDLTGGGRPAYAPVNEGPGPAMRFGLLNRDVVERLHFVHGRLGPLLSDALPEPVDLLAIAAAGLAQGDELHARVGVGSGLLMRHVEVTGEAAEFLGANPQWFLNLWMAACLCALSAARAYGKGDVLIAAGGNGQEFGIQIARAPGRWISAPASPPSGPGAPGVASDIVRLPAIGDSAVIDAIGFGALALEAAPAHAAHFPGEWVAALNRTASAQLVAKHPVLGRRIGVDTARVETAGPPSVCLAALDVAGQLGLIGFGIAQHPAALYGIERMP